MTSPSTVFRPYSRLVKIALLHKQVEVPENNALLRCLQYLAPEAISYGRFCWNDNCQYCRVTHDLGDGSKERAALSCKLIAEEGMRVREVSREISYCLRDLRTKQISTVIPNPPQAGGQEPTNATIPAAARCLPSPLPACAAYLSPAAPRLTWDTAALHVAERKCLRLSARTQSERNLFSVPPTRL